MGVTFVIAREGDRVNAPIFAKDGTPLFARITVEEHGLTISFTNRRPGSDPIIDVSASIEVTHIQTPFANKNQLIVALVDEKDYQQDPTMPSYVHELIENTNTLPRERED